MATNNEQNKSKIDVQDLGTHCSFSDCNRLDFLPIRCTKCLKTFCREHSSYTAHKCECYDHAASGAGGENQLGPLNLYKCTFNECPNKEMVEVICEFCKLTFCMKHRLQIDHNCAKKIEEKLRDEAVASRKIQPKEFKFEMKQNVSEKNAGLASKLLIMKLKQTAQGPSGLTEELKIYFYIHFNSEKKPFFFSAKWPIGRCIEFVLEKLNLPKSDSTKLRFFLDNENQIDSSQILDDLVKSNEFVTPGTTLILKEI